MPQREPIESGRDRVTGPDRQNRTVLVTGGTGFVGGWCVIELLRRGYRVRTTVRDLAREGQLRAALGSQVQVGDRLTVLAADLTADRGWAEAVDGCEFVLHVASPFPAAQPKDPERVIGPAREGTVRVLGAAFDAGVERVVVTSSIAAIRNRPGAERESPLTEESWTDLAMPKLSAYARSKTIAERAAWELARERGATERLAAVNPGLVLGPVLDSHRSTSLEPIERLLAGMPGAPRLGWSVVDVRDVAELHVLALTAPEAAGERWIATGPFMWMSEVAAILRERLGPAASKVPARTVPDLLVRAMAIFDPGIRSVAPDLGKRVEFSSEKARARLGWSPRPAEETIVECARSVLR